MILWEDADELDRLGHGIEIHHADVRGTVVAFIDGFEWLHFENKPARVRMLKQLGPATRRAEVERAVVRVPQGPKRDGRITKKITAWLNG